MQVTFIPSHRTFQEEGPAVPPVDIHAAAHEAKSIRILRATVRALGASAALLVRPDRPEVPGATFTFGFTGLPDAEVHVCRSWALSLDAPAYDVVLGTATPEGIHAGLRYATGTRLVDACGRVDSVLAVFGAAPRRWDADDHVLFEELAGLAAHALEAPPAAAHPVERQAAHQAEHVRAFYEQILDQLPTQLAVFDAAGRYVYVTPSAIRDPELRRWIVGKTDLEYFERRRQDWALGEARQVQIRRVFETATGQVFEETMHTRDGLPRHYIRMLTPITDATGAVVYAVGHSLDVTERKQFEQQLITAKTRAEELNNLKTSFLANMSHEIRTPLTSILGFADILAEEVGDECREFAHLIRHSGERLMETLNSVLDLAQLEGRTFRLMPTCFDLETVAHDTLQLFHPQAEARGLTLSFEQATPGPITLETDRSALCRVLVNLITNAVKFTKAGGVTVTVGTEASHAWVAVSDTGIGIRPSFLPHLFDEFKQESTGIGRDYEGSGLGLAITKRLLDLMGGAIEVESERGHGSTFTIRLPMAG